MHITAALALACAGDGSGRPGDEQCDARGGGYVELEFRITAAGAVEDPRVLRSCPEGEFDAAALKAAAGWRYAATGRARTERVRLSFEPAPDKDRDVR